jgi:hypothetical protein
MTAHSAIWLLSVIGYFRELEEPSPILSGETDETVVLNEVVEGSPFVAEKDFVPKPNAGGLR